MNEKNLALAIGLNFVLPGAGYAYMGRWGLAVLAWGVIAVTLWAWGLIGWLSLQAVLFVAMTIDMFIMHSKHKKELHEANTKECPQCAERIQIGAKICRFCQFSYVRANAPGMKPKAPAPRRTSNPDDPGQLLM